MGICRSACLLVEGDVSDMVVVVLVVSVVLVVLVGCIGGGRLLSFHRRAGDRKSVV